MNRQLWFGPVLVAELKDVLSHQGSWFARYQQVVTPQQGPQEQRLCDYIEFCEQWHERLNRDEDVDPADFDAFEDIVDSASWSVPSPDGTPMTKLMGPIFVDGEVTWNLQEARSPAR